MAGRLSIVATPIGNLGDISARALDTLRAADVVLAEDTRVTGKLLAHFGIQTRLERCDENVIAANSAALVQRMLAGERMAFCSDAGTPGVSDPGMRLVAAAQDAGIQVEAIPGASALLTALASSGLVASSFYFGAFLPRKAGEREGLLESLKPLDAILVFYESPHRTLASLESIARVFPQREVVMARELTKLHEEVVRAAAPDLLAQLQAREGELKGEVVLLVGPPTADEMRMPSATPEQARELAQALMVQGASRSAAAKAVASQLGLAKNDVYSLLV